MRWWMRGCVLMCLLVGVGCAAGNLSMEARLAQVDDRLDAAIPEMTDCFRRELGAEANRLDGRVVVRFEVSGDGLVNRLEVVESELGSPKAELCVSDTIRRIYFPEWVGRQPVRLTKPLQFVAGR